MNDYQNKSLFWSFLLLISYQLLAPSDGPGLDLPHFDKLVHGCIFFVLTALLIRAYQMSTLQYFTIAAAYGLISEYLQAQTGYRSGDPLDWLADISGTLLLLAAYHRWPKGPWQKEKRQHKQQTSHA
jgi:VanZ family protein